jgi:predicted aspartyl protease
MTDMGTFRIDFEVASQLLRETRLLVGPALVDTGSEATWIPATTLEKLGAPRLKRARFRQATGQVVERWLGPVVIFAAGTHASDDVVFAEPGDLTLLGARTLEGLNVTVDPVQKRLVDAGPMPAAAA